VGDAKNPDVMHRIDLGPNSTDYGVWFCFLARKKDQLTLAIKLAGAAGPRLFSSFSPSKKLLRSFVGLRSHQKPFSMVGEARYDGTNITWEKSVKTF